MRVDIDSDTDMTYTLSGTCVARPVWCFAAGGFEPGPRHRAFRTPPRRASDTGGPPVAWTV